MRDSDYYAPGSYHDPSAPWNECEVPEQDFDIEVTVTLKKTCTVTTNDYIPGASGCDYEQDEDGCHAVGWQEDDDTSCTDWNKAYKESCYTIPQMLEELKKYVEREIDERKAIGERVPNKLKQLLGDCTGWEEDDTYCEY